MSTLDDLKPRAQERDILEVARELGADLKRATATEWAGPCPICRGGTDRFAVSTRDQIWSCRQCPPEGGQGQAGGDVISLVQRTRDCGFREAVEWLSGEDAERRDDGYERGQARSAAPRERGDSSPAEPRERAQPRPKPKGKRVPVNHFDYTDRDGNLIYQVVRFQFRLPDDSWEVDESGKPQKKFGQRRPSRIGDDSWIWALRGGEFMRRGPNQDWVTFNEKQYATFSDDAQKRAFSDGVEHSLYRWPKVEIAVAEGRTIVIPEGEKNVETVIALLEPLGFEVTTNSGGSKNWRPDHAAVLAGADVVIPIDNDEAGRERGEKMARSLRPHAKRVRILDFAKVWPDIPPKGDVTDWAEAGGTAEKLVEIIDGLEDWRPAPPKSRFKGVLLESVGISLAKKHSWIVNDLLPANDLSMISGPSQSGKSFLAEEIALCISQGETFFGHKVKHGGIVYVAGEGGLGFGKRLYGYKLHHDLNGKDSIPFVLLPTAVNIYRKDGDVKPLIEEIEAWREYWLSGYGINLQAVFIDTLAASVAGADENSFKDMSTVLENCKLIVDQCGCAVVLVHHTNAQGTKVRGHSSVFGNIETAISVTVDEETKIRTATIAKQKDGEAGWSFRFALMQVEVGIREDDGKPITTCVVVAPGEKESYRAREKAKGFRLTDSEVLPFKALLEALNQYAMPAPSGVNIPPDRKVVEYRHWREAYVRIAAFDDDGSEEAAQRRDREIRTRMKAVGQSLLKCGVIGRDNTTDQRNPLVWWTGKPVRGFSQTFPKPEPEPEADAEASEPVGEPLPF